MKKIIIVCFIIVISVILSSCTGNPESVNSFKPISSDVSIKPAESILPTETAAISPSITPEQVVKVDIPGYISAGLPSRVQMAPELEQYYYMFQYYNITNYDEDSGEIWRYNTNFDNETVVDLNGDGKEDNVKIIGGKVKLNSKIYEGSKPFYYESIIIDINGERLKVKCPDDSYVFELRGMIIDIDKEDGQKELFISAYQEQGDSKDYIITYHGVPKIILKEKRITSVGPADGSGYIIIGKDYKDVSYDELWRLKGDSSGFEFIDTKYYPTSYQLFLWDEEGKWTEEEAAETEWDQYLYSKPNGTMKVKINKGTQIYIGLYANKGWLMILDTKGNFLGWLDIKKVNLLEYTGYMFEMEDE